MRNDLPDWKMEPDDEPGYQEDYSEIDVDLDVEDDQIRRLPAVVRWKRFD